MSTMSISASTSPRRRRAFSVAAVFGLVLALGWFIAVRVLAAQNASAQRTAQVERGARLVTLLRHLAQDRVKSAAQVLAQDTRLQAAAGQAELDQVTANDLLQDLQKLDPQEIYALLNADGRVVVTRGAPQMDGLELGSSAAVKTAMGQEEAAIGVWLVDNRVVEMAVSAIRVGDRRVGLLVVGVKVEDASLATAAAAAGVHLALMLEGKPVWASEPLPETTWRIEPTAVVEATESARYLVAPAPGPADPLDLLSWAVPLAALLFAALGFWRGGSP